jgi:hypothetical protein
MVVFVIVGFIPVFGFFLWLFAYLLGLGAVTTQALRALSQPASA